MSNRYECKRPFKRGVVAHSTENVSRETIALQITTLNIWAVEMFHVKHFGLANSSDVIFGRTHVGGGM